MEVNNPAGVVERFMVKSIIGRCKADHYEYYISHRRLEEGHDGELLEIVFRKTLCYKGICGSRSNITYAHRKDMRYHRVVGLR
jgi:hypothetical protein